MPAPTAAQLALFMDAFPASLEPQVAQAACALDMSTYGVHADKRTCFVVGGETRWLPARLGARVSENVRRGLAPEAALILDALMTRHHDGFVRQRHLRRLFDAPRVHTVPFMLHLLGEHVYEVVADVDAGTRDVDPEAFKSFLGENKDFLWLIGERVVSYWDCYYKWNFPVLGDYPGWKAVTRLRHWAAPGEKQT